MIPVEDVAATESYTLDAFLAALAARLNVADTWFYRNFMRRWIKFESGDTIGAAFNPLNTTLDYGSNTRFNDVGVRNYADFATGVEATARTLEESSYIPILAAFRQQSLTGVWRDLQGALRVWGTGAATGAYAFADELANLTRGGFGALPDVPSWFPDAARVIVGIAVPGAGGVGVGGVLGPVGGAIGGAAGAVGGAAGGVIDTIGDVTGGTLAVIRAILNPQNWVRAFLIVAGGVLVVVGVIVYMNDTKAGKAAISAASKGAL